MYATPRKTTTRTGRTQARHQWKRFSKNLTELTDVVDYLTYYISDIYENEKGAHNKAIGLKAALEYALREMYEYASLGASEITQEDYDEYGDEITAADIENSDRIRCLRLNLESVEKIKFIDE